MLKSTWLIRLRGGLIVLALLVVFACLPVQAAWLDPVTGLRWTTERVAAKVLTYLLKKELLRDGDIKLSLSSPSLSDLRHRRLRDFQLSGNGWIMRDGLPVDLVALRYQPQNNMPNRLLAFTLDDPPALKTAASFRLATSLSLVKLNEFFSSPAGGVWLRHLQADSFGAFQSVRITQRDQRLVFNGQWVPKLIGQWVQSPVAFSGIPRVEKGQLMLDHPQLTILGLRDSGEVSRVANRFLRQLINPARHTIEGHHIQPFIQDIQLNNNRLTLTALLTVKPAIK